MKEENHVMKNRSGYMWMIVERRNMKNETTQRENYLDTVIYFGELVAWIKKTNMYFSIESRISMCKKLKGVMKSQEKRKQKRHFVQLKSKTRNNAVVFRRSGENCACGRVEVYNRCCEWVRGMEWKTVHDIKTGTKPNTGYNLPLAAVDL